MKRLPQKPAVWLDSDPGVDDAWAIIVAASTCEVRGLSTVAGNVPLPDTYANARRIARELSQNAWPILPGADQPLLSPLMTATAYHGQTGLGDWSPNDRDSEPLDFRARVWQWWHAHAQEMASVHLVVTGPPTNLAIGALAFPELRSLWASVTLMGGALPGAQVDKAQEFNVYVDPHAADIVMHWIQRLQLIGLNVAHKALIPVSDLSRLTEYGRVGTMLRHMLTFYLHKARGEGGQADAFPIDDVVALAAVVHPEFFHWREMPLAVVREGPLRGTVVLSPSDIRRPPVRVATDIDVRAFRAWLWESMDAYRPQRNT
ncbi:MAG: nucleoside hydrolase [Firmicutes bacterium]|nr:nucleoside hydrolase [Bacillota bacterium]